MHDQVAAIQLLQNRRPREAMRILAALPPDADVLTNTGLAHEDLGELGRAEAAYARALELDPRHVPARSNRGSLLLRSGRVDAAADDFAAIVDGQPGDGRAWYDLAHARMKQARVAEGLESFRRAGAASDWLFAAIHTEGDHAGKHRQWGEAFGARFAGEAIAAPRGSYGRRLRVGYVGHHMLPRFAVPVIANHSSGVDVFVYSDAAGGPADPFTPLLKRRARGGWRDVRAADDAAVARRVRADGVDVLVDLCGHMDGGRRLGVFARRPAPVLVQYAGYPHPTGLPGVHAIADEPYAFLGDRDAPRVTRLPALRSGRVTFGSVNRAWKFSPRTAGLWSRVIAAVPGSRLLVLAAGGEGNTFVRQLLESAGVPGHRLELAPTGDEAQYFATINRIDVALDAFPYNGMTTTCECLWQGVPVVTRSGEAVASRVGARLLAGVRLDHLAAATDDGYVAAAAALAGDLVGLAGLRDELRCRMKRGPLANGNVAARQLESEYARLAGRV